ncbi:YdcF family protein [Selenomonadales bacterium OttesenSCG-928-I06]|nr:YdcF family protein [Selenomonadales bacterium OttesenSCG-928-I06]
MNKKKIIKKAFFIAILLFICFVVYSAFDIYSYGDKNEMTKADVAIVLGAEVWNDKPSPVFQERINHGIWLYQNGYVDKILFTGGKSNHNKYSESFIARQYAIKNGVPSEDILIEEKSTITQENIYFAVQIIKNSKMSTAILVSDPLHMKRAMLMAKDNKLTVYSSPTPTTMYKSLETKLPFLAREIFFYIGYIIVHNFYDFDF